MEKKIFRNCAKLIRTKLDLTELSTQLVHKIKTLDEYKLAKHILLYYPKEGELDLTSLAAEEDKVFYLPRLENECIVACPWQLGEELQISKYKIYEPLSSACPIEQLDLIITPGLCADKNKNRLGYGKGCYDTLLEKCDAKVVFPVPDELLFDELPVEKHDKKVCIIVTQTKVIL